MVLRREDFVVFVANWRPKPEALEAIARELNIGLDALVFVDDNPAERELVRQVLPQVRVVELSEDPSEYPRLLDATGWLDTVRLTDEDRRKTEQYRENRERGALEAQHADYGAYLASLDQRAIIRPFGRDSLDRVTQLVNKTNQFNLTTRRMSRSEVEALVDRADVLTASVRLLDRFGDNGIISAFVGHVDDNVLDIDLWLMSCRVFKRGVEHLLANHVFAWARGRGLRRVRGTYIPTEKNGIVASFYAELGFATIRTAQDRASTWLLAVDDFRPLPVYIALTEEVGA
jgi:FkbH-like protein